MSSKRGWGALPLTTIGRKSGHGRRQDEVGGAPVDEVRYRIALHP
jgi:hypothetical protein